MENISSTFNKLLRNYQSQYKSEKVQKNYSADHNHIQLHFIIFEQDSLKADHRRILRASAEIGV